MQLIDGMKHSIYTQQTRLRQIYTKKNSWLLETYVVKELLLGANSMYNPQNVEIFMQILADFLLNSYNRRNIIMKTLQQGYFTAFLRKKRVRARAYATMCVDFLRF